MLKWYANRTGAYKQIRTLFIYNTDQKSVNSGKIKIDYSAKIFLIIFVWPKVVRLSIDD